MSAVDLKELLEDRVGGAPVPAGDLDRARLVGRRIRRRRRTTGAVAVVGAAALVGSLAVASSDGPSTGTDPSRFAAVGALDFSGGLRAYADPGVEIHLGGRTFDASSLDYLDTDAAATPWGVVFYDAGRPMLLDESGTVRSLVDGPVEAPEGFHPTAKADARTSLVVWATVLDGTATITARDMDTGEDVASTEIGCGACADLVIDGIDGGTVFVRDADGTRTWDSATGEWSDFAGPGTRVADVRGGVVLFDGPVPTTPAGWRTVRGEVDAQLSFDGRYVLGWSRTLEPTDGTSRPVTLDVGGAKEGLGFYTFDTDGSVLVAYTDAYPRFTVSDCALPSGRCTTLGPLRPTGGDPMFIGNDM